MFYMAPGQNLVGFYKNNFYTNGPIELIFLSCGKAGSRRDLNRKTKIYFFPLYKYTFNIGFNLRKLRKITNVAPYTVVSVGKYIMSRIFLFERITREGGDNVS